MLRKTLVIVTAILLTIFARFGMPKMSGDIKALYPRSSTALSDLNFIEGNFGDQLIDVILVPLPDGFSESARTSLLDLEEAIQDIAEISNITSPLKADSKVPLPVRLRSGNWGRFILEIPGDLSDDDRRAISAKLDEIRPANSIRSGSFYATDVATRTLEEENQIRAPLCLITIIAIVFFFSRSILVTVVVLIPPSITLLTVGALLVITATPLGAVAQLVAPLLLAVSTSYSIYLASRILGSPEDTDPLLGAGSSLTLAAGTTIGGFLSLFCMGSRGVDQFAFLMASGSALSAVLSWFIVPQLLPRTRRGIFSRTVTLPRGSTRIGCVIALVLLVLGTGLSRLQVDTVPLDFFKIGSKEAREIQHAAEVFPGSHVLNIGLEFAEPIDEQLLSRIATLENAIRVIPGVVSVSGAVEFSTLWEYLQKHDLGDASLMGRFGPESITSSDLKKTRIVIDTDREGEALRKMAAQIRAVLQKQDFAIRTAVASPELVVADQSSALTSGLVESFGAALLLVWFLLLVFFRNLRLSLVGLVPNVLPILGIVGALAYSEAKINLGASLVAGCVLGMVSDYTFHLLFLWRQGRDLRTAVNDSIVPFLVTGVTLVIGFMPTVFSSVAPVRSFGLLFAEALTLGIFLNLAILRLLERFFVHAGKNG